MKQPLASQNDFRRIADAVLGAVTADHAQVNFRDSYTTTLRFANNQVVQHITETGPDVTVQVAFGNKVGSAGANRLDGDSLEAMVLRAEQIAKLAPEDPEYLPPLPAQQYLDVPGFRDATAEASPIDLAKRTKPVIERCIREGLVAAGTMIAGASAAGVAAKSGLFGYQRLTEAEFSLTATGDDSTGWSYMAHRDINTLDVRRRTESAVEKAVKSKNPREIPAGHYPVILEPAAVAGILGGILRSAGAKSFFKGNSAFVGKLGSVILDPRLTLRTDPSHPDLMGSRFGGDGLATRKQTWIEKGVLKQLYYDRFTAKEHNVEPTAFPSAVIASYDQANARCLDDLIAQTKRAILITNFWYIRPVDPTDLTMTGMTRDGTFLVEDGKIVCGVKNFRFHDSPLRCFAQIDAATAPQEAITLERGKMLLPAVRLPDFHLSSVTKF